MAFTHHCEFTPRAFLHVWLTHFLTSLSLHKKAENYIASYTANSKTTQARRKPVPLKSMAAVHHFLFLFHVFHYRGYHLDAWSACTEALKHTRAGYMQRKKQSAFSCWVLQRKQPSGAGCRKTLKELHFSLLAYVSKLFFSFSRQYTTSYSSTPAFRNCVKRWRVFFSWNL